MDVFMQGDEVARLGRPKDGRLLSKRADRYCMGDGVLAVDDDRRKAVRVAANTKVTTVSERLCPSFQQCGELLAVGDGQHQTTRSVSRSLMRLRWAIISASSGVRGFA